MKYIEKLQELLDERGDEYKLKTDSDLIGIIVEFGFGETEFHTQDIERLLKENAMLKKVLLCVVSNLSLSQTNLDNEHRRTEAVKQGKELLENLK